MPAEMTLRDHFAAAALTGLLARPDVDADPLEHHFCCEDAYKWADAMLRCRAGGDCPGPDNAPNLDAAPAAKAGTPGTGDTQEPVAWGVVDDRGLQLALHPTPEHASYYARNFGSGLAAVVPLYRHPQPTLTDAEREAVRVAVVEMRDHMVYGCGHRYGVAETLQSLLDRLK